MKDLVRRMSELERMLRNQSDSKNQPQPIADIGPSHIQFTIVTASVETGTAIGTVTHRPCKKTKVPGESGGLVNLYDTMGFFTDEVNEDLVGRKGTAWYTLPNGGSACIWAINGLMCDPGA